MRLRSLRSRVEKLEGARGGDDLLIIRVEGGLPPPAPLKASFNHQYMTQDDGEDEQSFRERAITAAELARAKIVVIGTMLGPEPWERDYEARQGRQRADDGTWIGLE